MFQDRTTRLGLTNQQLENLFDTGRHLLSAADLATIAESLERHTSRLFGFTINLFVVSGERLIPVVASTIPESILDIARSSLQNSACVRGEDAIACRMDGIESAIGAIVITASYTALPKSNLVQALAGLTAVAVERAQLASTIAEAEAEARMSQMKSALLASVSHDLRSPLSAISAAASGLVEYRESIDEETTSRLLSTILTECSRLDRLTANLLEMSRLEGGRDTLKHEKISVSELVAVCVEAMKRLSPGYHLRHMPATGDDTVVADAALFELALMNILQNAVRYSDPGSTVTVTEETQSNSCIVKVVDQGIGIAASDLPHVFERFYRGTGHQTRSRGTGLGLTIAKAFVEFFGGSIEVTSPMRDGAGTCVEFRLPLARRRA